MASLVFYGGVNEIGGNKILLQERNTKVFLDFGKSFSERAYFYEDPFLTPKEMEDLLELGLIDHLEEVYRLQPPRPGQLVDAIFLSHVHADHADHIALSHPTIPIYVSEIGKLILDSLKVTRFPQIDSDFRENSFRTFQNENQLRIGSLAIETLAVDHSIPGSFGFIVHTSKGAIAYTGDFRMHGPNAQLSQEFVEKIREAKPIAFITEGTNAFSFPFLNEEEIQEKISTLIGCSPGLIVISFLSKDIDRLHTILKATSLQGRKLVLPLKYAHLLRSLSRAHDLTVPFLEEENLLFYLKRRGCLYDWENELWGSLRARGKVITTEEISSRQKEFVLNLNFYDLPELIKIKPIPGSLFISSLTEPYSEEMELDFTRLTHWLEHFGMPLYSLHSSGHILPHDLKRVAEEIKAKKLFLIHSDYPELLARYLQGTAGEIIIPEKGKVYEL